MAAGTAPIFVKETATGAVRLAAANTNRDGSGTLSTLFTAGADGSVVDRIVATQSPATAGANSGKVLLIFVTDTAGANPMLRGELLINSVTSSAVAIGSTATFTFSDGLPLESGQIVKVCMTIYGSAADQLDVIAEGGNY